MAGTSVTNDTWSATCAGLADQSGNGKNATMATASAQPVLTVGYNGKPGLLFDGVNDELRSTVNTLLTALPYQTIVIARYLSTAANQVLVGTDGFTGPAIYQNAANTVQGYNGTAGLTIAGFVSTSQTRFSALFTGSTSDVLRAGSGSRTGVNGGTAIPSATATHVGIGRFEALGIFGNIEVLAVMVVPPTALGALDAALNSAAGYGPGAIAV